MNNENLALLRSRAYNLRVLSLQATTAAGSGHPTSALSAADIVAALYFYAMQYDLQNFDSPDNDRFILSKGHAAPVLYAAYKELGLISFEELLTLRQFGSNLEGHPTARCIYNEAATGSLGCGLSIGLGMALANRLDKSAAYIYVLLGDSEMAEGSVWEAAEIAAYYKTSHLIAIVDLNRLGQSTQTLDDHNMNQHEQRWQAFGWNTITIDGHSMEQITNSLDKACSLDNAKPTVIIAHTIKGYGLDGIEDKEGYHGRAFTKEHLPELLKKMEQRFASDARVDFEVTNYTGSGRIAIKTATQETLQETGSQVWGGGKVPPLVLPPASYKKGTMIATRKAYGETLALLGDYSQRVVALDAEVKNSTFAEIFEKHHPDRFFQCFVAEQNMVGMATGFVGRHFIPFSSTFACFFSRAHDQIRMASIGRAALRLAGSHAGVSIGQDGPSQMGLEDIAMMRALPDSIVLYPSDAVCTYALINHMTNYHEGISYLRLTRAETPVLYGPLELFYVGGCKVLKESKNDVACIIAAGITVHQALKAYEELKARNIMVSVIDLYSVKPLDTETIIAQARKAGGRVITVEDHFIQGGLGEAVCYTLRNENIRIELLAVCELSRSGKPEELLAYHRIDHVAIIETVMKELDSSK